jgi:eukaryotic-like serine/threonine-protein kinase
MGTGFPSPELVLEQLEHVLQSPSFRSADRSAKILRFLVEQTVAGQADRLKEYVIGTEALGRDASFDPRIDSIARVEVSRLRNRLEQYYATSGGADRIRFVLPRGSYVPSFEERPEVATEAPPPSRGVRSGWVIVGAVLGGVVLLGVFWLLVREKSGQAVVAGRPLMELELTLPPETTLANVVGPQMTLSPDGTSLVIVANRKAGGSELRMRRLDRRDFVTLPGTEGARGPFFSPDSEWVAFWAAGKLKKISLRGGEPMVLCDAPDLLGGSWGDDGQIVATLSTEAKLWRLASAGGPAKPVLDLAPQLLRLLWPQVLPGSKSILYSRVGQTPDSGAIEVLSLIDGKRKALVRSGVFGRYLPSGHLVYVNQGTLYAQNFDLKSLEVQGTPFAVISNVAQSPVFGFAQYDFSSAGTLVYRRDSSGGQFVLRWLTPKGPAKTVVDKPGPYLWPRVSPSGKEIAYTEVRSGESVIWIAPREGGQARSLASAEGHGAAALWSPDGKFLVMQGQNGLEWMRAGESGPPQTLLKGGISVPWSFTPDGKRLAMNQLNPATHFDLWTVALEAVDGSLVAGAPEPFLRTKAVETYPTFSPDGRWIAYVSLQSGSYEIYVRSFPDSGKEVRVSKGGGRIPRWSQRTAELIYETDDHRLMVVPWSVQAGVFQAGMARLWSEEKLGDSGVLPSFDLAVDGTVLALMPADVPERSPDRITVLVNFFEELGRRPGAARR